VFFACFLCVLCVFLALAYRHGVVHVLPFVYVCVHHVCVCVCVMCVCVCPYGWHPQETHKEHTSVCVCLARTCVTVRYTQETQRTYKKCVATCMCLCMCERGEWACKQNRGNLFMQHLNPKNETLQPKP
jgi:hypothetical protein